MRECLRGPLGQGIGHALFQNVAQITLSLGAAAIDPQQGGTFSQHATLLSCPCKRVEAPGYVPCDRRRQVANIRLATTLDLAQRHRRFLCHRAPYEWVIGTAKLVFSEKMVFQLPII